MLDVPRLIHWAIATPGLLLGNIGEFADVKSTFSKPESQASGALEAATATHRQKIDYRFFARDETTATAL